LRIQYGVRFEELRFGSSLRLGIFCYEREQFEAIGSVLSFDSRISSIKWINDRKLHNVISY